MSYLYLRSPFSGILHTQSEHEWIFSNSFVRNIKLVMLCFCCILISVQTKRSKLSVYNTLHIIYCWSCDLWPIRVEIMHHMIKSLIAYFCMQLLQTLLTSTNEADPIMVVFHQIVNKTHFTVITCFNVALGRSMNECLVYITHSPSVCALCKLNLYWPTLVLQCVITITYYMYML